MYFALKDMVYGYENVNTSNIVFIPFFYVCNFEKLHLSRYGHANFYPTFSLWLPRNNFTTCTEIIKPKLWLYILQKENFSCVYMNCAMF